MLASLVLAAALFDPQTGAVTVDRGILSAPLIGDLPSAARTYALGRRVEYTDMPMIRAIVRDAAKKDNKLSAFVMGVVNSSAFKMGVADTGKNERRATDVAGQR